MKLKLEKSSGLNGIRIPGLCDTGAVLYQLIYQAIWELVTLWVRNIPVEGQECKGGNIWKLIYLNCGERAQVYSMPNWHMLFANREFRNGKNCCPKPEVCPDATGRGLYPRPRACLFAIRIDQGRANSVFSIVFFFATVYRFFSLKVIFVLSFNFNSDVRVCLTFGAHKACCLQNLFWMFTF